MTEFTTAPSRGFEEPETSGETPGTNGGATRGTTRCVGGAMLFPELVLAHYRYFALHARYGEAGGIPSRYSPDGKKVGASELDKAEAKRAYEQALECFEESAGSIRDAYWCVVAPSAIALTEEPRHRVLRFLWKSEPTLRLHRATDWLTNTYPDISILLHHCDTIAIKAAAVLRGTAKQIALTSVYSEEKFLLAAAEERAKQKRRSTTGGLEGKSRGKTPVGGGVMRNAPASPPSEPPVSHVAPPMDLVSHARDVLIEIEKYYDLAGNRAARIVYFWGMVTGVIVALALAAVFALIVHLSFMAIDVDKENVRNFFICYAAGALGAVVSVLMRMKKEDGFTLDYEIGRSQSFRLGSFRPFLGAVFGLLIYFALESGMLQIAVPDRDPTTDATEVSPYFLALVAFVAGFSERLAHVVLGKTERTVAATFEVADERTTASVVGTAAASPNGLGSELRVLARGRQEGSLNDQELQDRIQAAIRAELERG